MFAVIRYFFQIELLFRPWKSLATILFGDVVSIWIVLFKPSSRYKRLSDYVRETQVLFFGGETSNTQAYALNTSKHPNLPWTVPSKNTCKMLATRLLESISSSLPFASVLRTAELESKHVTNCELSRCCETAML